jgi:hypothetical protein
MSELRGKYNAHPADIDGYHFDSEAEASRYKELKLLIRSGEIGRLQVHPRFEIDVNGKHCGFYKADFQYYDFSKKEFIVEDVKGYKTDVYILKKKLVEAIHGIEIVEITT